MSSKLLTNTYKQVKRSNRQTERKPDNKAAGDRPNDGALQKDMVLLKQFDLNWEYGPCTGITRLERWERAQKHGLNPPAEVKTLINQHLNNDDYTKSLWNGYDL